MAGKSPRSEPDAPYETLDVHKIVSEAMASIRGRTFVLSNGRLLAVISDPNPDNEGGIDLTSVEDAIRSSEALGEYGISVEGTVVQVDPARLGVGEVVGGDWFVVHPSPNLDRAAPLTTRARMVVDLLGVTQTAELLGVSKSQPSRWRSGEERPGPEKARELVDLDHVIARAALLWEPEVIQDWLKGSEPFLDGARPIDVLRQRGVTEVIQALDAVAAGGFA